jgi:hypothetical protein
MFYFALALLANMLELSWFAVTNELAYSGVVKSTGAEEHLILAIS